MSLNPALEPLRRWGKWRWLNAFITLGVLAGCGSSPLDSSYLSAKRASVVGVPRVQKLLAASAERLLVDGQNPYIHHDHLGSHTLSTTRDAGVSGRAAFAVFGITREHHGFVDERGFTGQQVDDSTALHHFQNRCFDAASGRWTAPDPLFSFVASKKMPLGQATAAYAYVANTPLNSVDPTGLLGESPRSGSPPPPSKGNRRAEFKAMLAAERQARNSKPAGPAERGSGGWKTKTIGGGYEGEEGRGVRYYKGAANDEFRLTIKEGKLYNNKGDLFDTSGGSPTFQEQQKAGALFVMSAEGVFYATNYHEVGRVHHSSLMAGGSVAAAGEMVVKNGVPEAINRQSGHYRPDVGHLNQAVTELRSAGVALKDETIAWGSRADTTAPRSVN